MARRKLAVIGHSTASWAGTEVNGSISFIDLLLNHFAFILVAKGVNEGSEDRTLDVLKNIDPPDICVIFHSSPQHIYLPSCKRDINIKKFNRAEHVFDPRVKGVEHYDWDQGSIPYFTRSQDVRDTFDEDWIFIQTVMLYKRFLYTPESRQNQFYGSLQQIDQYCLAKNIAVIHVPQADNFPPWLKKMKSGKMMPEIAKIANDYMGKPGDEVRYPNNVNAEGQTLIYQILAREIEEMIASGKI